MGPQCGGNARIWIKLRHSQNLAHFALFGHPHSGPQAQSLQVHLSPQQHPWSPGVLCAQLQEGGQFSQAHDLEPAIGFSVVFWCTWSYDGRRSAILTLSAKKFFSPDPRSEETISIEAPILLERQLCLWHSINPLN